MAELFDYYQQELITLRQGAQQFAAQHPTIARYLGWQTGQITDPSIEHLLEGVAFLNARVHARLDEAHHTMGQTVLKALAPNIEAAIPSTAIIQFAPLANGKVATIPRGQTLDVTFEQTMTANCRTCYTTEILPLTVTSINWHTNPLSLIHNSHIASGTVLAIHLALTPGANPAIWQQLKKLNFYIHAPRIIACRFYYLFCAQLTATSWQVQDQLIGQVLSTPIQRIGFEDEQALWFSHQPTHLRLLQEYLLFPEKFLFFALPLPQAGIFNQSHQVTIYCHFQDRDLPRYYTLPPDLLKLSCTPISNEFLHSLPIISLDFRAQDYRLTSDMPHTEPLRVTEVLRIQPQKNTPDPIPALFHNEALIPSPPNNTSFWYTTLKDNMLTNETHLHLSIVDPQFNPAITAIDDVLVYAWCSQGAYCAQLIPPRITLADNELASITITQCTPFSAYLPASYRPDQHWQLVSLLQRCLQPNTHALLANDLHLLLQQLVRHQTAETAALHQQLLAINMTPCLIQPTNIRWPETAWFGTDVTLIFNGRLSEIIEWYLFSVVLNHVLSCYTTLNTALRLRVKSSQGDELWQLPPTIGQHPISSIA